ncbi:MAG: M28 family peptidase [Bacteroidota bacterium]
MIKKTNSIISILWIFVFLGAPGCSSLSIIDQLQQEIYFLASDSLEGRRTGTVGERRATDFIASEFDRLGIQRAGENETYFQPFYFVASVTLGKNNNFNISTEDTTIVLTLNKDFRPFGFSADTSITAPIAFAGYGISAPDLKYDDYSGIDVKGKIVIVMKDIPNGDQPHSPFTKFGDEKLKIMTAREKGAAGFVLVPSPSSDESDSLPRLRYDSKFTNVGLPCVQMTRSPVTALFRHLGQDFPALQKQIDSLKTPQSLFFEKTRATLTTTITKVTTTARNVVGYLEGNDSRLKDEYIIVGGHHDHLGWGGEGSLMPDTVAIHPGADDNASGTAGVLELARYFAAERKHLRRSILFATFSGEEEGLLGSAYFVKNPPRPLSNAIAMINLDMIGRMKDSVVLLGGMGTSDIWKDIVQKFNEPHMLNIKPNNDGYGPSDHSSFYGKNMPVLFFFTSLHKDYHRPSDRADLINYEGEKQILKFVARIIDTLAVMPARPQFIAVQSSSTQETPTYKVTLGVIPDFSESEIGFKITGVRPDGPAAKAGLKGGDIIIKLGGKAIKNIYDYTFLLGEFKTGDETEVVVKRNGEEKIFKVRFEKRKN